MFVPQINSTYGPGITSLADGAYTFRAAFYLCNEGLSIFENAALIGLPVPESIRRALEQLRKGDARNEDPE